MKQSICRIARVEQASICRNRVVPLALPICRRPVFARETRFSQPHQPSRRMFSQGSARFVEEEPKRGLRISHLFGGLVILGMFVTIYGLYVLGLPRID